MWEEADLSSTRSPTQPTDGIPLVQSLVLAPWSQFASEAAAFWSLGASVGPPIGPISLI